MKTVVFEHYGSPEVLKIREIAKPTPKEHEILVRIHATAVNSGDVRLRKADPFAVRFMLGLFKPRIQTLGSVFSGHVEAVGHKVTRFKAGDEVFGSTDMKFGAYAEYKVLPETASIALKPAMVSHAEAAVVPFGGTTALFFLKKANIKPGQKVLIYGASGAVGATAVQLAKYFGAEVTAVCSTDNVSMVKSLGADHVIDYTKQNWLDMPGMYDVIYDTVNKMKLRGSMQKLKETGILLLGAAMLAEMISGSVLGKIKGKKVVFGVISHTAEDIAFLANLVQRGHLKSIIDRTYPIEQIAAAHAYVEQGHKKGNVAITI